MTKAEQIVAQLTKVEKDAMRKNDAHSVDSLWAINPRIAKRLYDKGLLYVELSPIGIEVSALLQGNYDD